MITTELIEKHKNAEIKEAEKLIATNVSIQCLGYAKRLSSLLALAFDCHNLVMEYLQNGNPIIFTTALDPLNLLTINAFSDGEFYYLTSFFMKYPMPETEFIIFCYICICNMEFKSFPEQQQVTIKFLQHFTMQKLQQQPNLNINENRFKELSNNSQRFLHLFYAFFF